ncbi:MAG: galactose oxidase, partial [Gammaproteobacteria bacterium]
MINLSNSSSNILLTGTPARLALAIGSALMLSACGGGDSGQEQTDTPSTNSNQVVAGDQAEAPPEPVFKSSYTPEGAFSEAFAEPTISVEGETVTTDERCLTREDGTLECKPAAGTLALLADGRFLYLNALEGTENVELSIVAEFGEVSVNDQTRVLSLTENDTPNWLKPTPLRAGANPDGNDSQTLLNGTPLDGMIDTADNTSKNDGALFCSDVVGLADGSVMAVGGTDYYSEPGVDGLPLGVAELEGIKNSRVFDARTNTWFQTGDMNFGRWYPSMVTLGSGSVFVASGVTKLLKPVYPEEPINSGRNVVQTETFNPC